MSELAADGIPVAVACRVLKLARQPYYRWLADPVTDAEWIEAHRANALFDAHLDDPEFGYRVPRRRSPRERAADGRPDRVADLQRERLLHHAHICVTDGQSFRLAQATTGKGVTPLAT